MLSVLAGTFVLALVHALIPNHWLPLVAVARAEGWTRREVSAITLIAALAHVTGTVALGVVLGLIGRELQQTYGTAIHAAASLLLIVFGLIYFTVNLPHHHHSAQRDVAAYKRSRRRWVLLFIALMFLSPCLEVESLFLSAGVYGMGVVTLMAVVYGVVSVSGIWLLVRLGHRGAHLLGASFIEHHEKRISGLVLILTGIISFFLH